MSAHIGPPEFEPAIGKPAAEIVSWLLSSQGDGTHWQNCVPQYCIAPACRYPQMSPHTAALGTPLSWAPPPDPIGAGKRATKSASAILSRMAGLLRNHASGPSASCWGLGHTPPSAVQTRPELSVTSATTGPGCDAMARSLSSPTATTATSSRVRMSVTIAVTVKSSQQYCNPSPCLV